MSKAVFVMDMPESCLDCQFCIELDEGIEAACSLVVDPYDDCSFREIDEDYCQEKPYWCPLKPMPDKRYVQNITLDYDGCYARWYASGWNDCVDEICEN